MVSPGDALKGRDTTVSVHDDAISIKYAVWAHGFKGEKRLPLSSIVSVQFKPAGGGLVGFIQFGILGGVESRGGFGAALRDENTVAFESKQNAAFEALRDWVQGRISAPRAPAAIDVAGEIEKFASLRDRGLITDDEFSERKALLLKR